MRSRNRLAIEALTREAFAPFGDVVEAASAAAITINQGYAERVNGLAQVETAGASAIVNISLFTARKRPLSISIRMMERHPLGSQLFYPLQERDWLAVVCTDPRDPISYRAFRATGLQGVNYARNVWHHPLLVLSDNERFIVVDRGDASVAPASNLEEVWLDEPDWLQLTPEG
jgi:ureidoglycolate lyase